MRVLCLEVAYNHQLTKVLRQLGDTLTNFLLAMTLYPEIQACAQAEIDMSIGDRPPTAADQSKLSYVTAILLETFTLATYQPKWEVHG